MRLGRPKIFHFHNLFPWTLLLIAIFQLGCKKSLRRTTLSGSVFEQGTNKPLSGVKVTLKGAVGCNNCGSPSSKSYAETITDAAGNYKFYFTPEDKIGYFLYGQKNQYFDYDGLHQAGSFLTTGGNQSFSFSMYAPGHLKLHVKNNTPFDNNDYMGLTDFSAIYFTGATVDTTFLLNYTYEGGKQFSLYWGIIKNGVQSSGHHDLYINPFDTLSVNIFY